MGGDVNHIGVIVSEAGNGKSTLLAQHAKEWIGGRGAWALIQDPGHQFRDFPFYPDVAAFRRRLAEGGRLARGAAVGAVLEEPFTELAIELAAARPEPVFIGYDEAVLVESASPSYISPRQRELLARRRHLGIAAEILAQDFGLLNRLWQMQSTDVWIAYCTDQERIAVLAKRFGRDRHELEAALAALGPFEYLHIKRGIRFTSQAPGRIPGKTPAARRR